MATLKEIYEKQKDVERRRNIIKNITQKRHLTYKETKRRINAIINDSDNTLDLPSMVALHNIIKTIYKQNKEYKTL